MGKIYVNIDSLDIGSFENPLKSEVQQNFLESFTMPGYSCFADEMFLE